jgi:hypothetical protein
MRIFDYFLLFYVLHWMPITVGLPNIAMVLRVTVHTSNNVADIFTKALTLQPFTKHRKLLGVLPPPGKDEN